MKDFEQAFCLARGSAITQYAYYEEALACLFAILMGVSNDVAGIPFFKINNARSRLAMIERLLKKRYGSKYNLFWNSLSKHIQVLDLQRNKVVHWTWTTVCSDPPYASLIPPNHWDADENTPSLLLADLDEFELKCVFFTSLIACFGYTLSDEPFVQPTWPEIFQQPVSYPPRSDHPLIQKPKTP